MTEEEAIQELNRLQKYIQGLHKCIMSGEITMGKMVQACDDEDDRAMLIEYKDGWVQETKKFIREEG